MRRPVAQAGPHRDGTETPGNPGITVGTMPAGFRVWDVRMISLLPTVTREWP